MLKLFVYNTCFLFFWVPLFGQGNINLPLKKELDSIRYLDQHYREVLQFITLNPQSKDSVAQLYNIPKDSVYEYLISKQEHIDSSNVIFVENVIRKYGYPGESIVGLKSSNIAWLVLQHSGNTKLYLPIIKKAVDKHDLLFRFYAMMLDRVLMNEGKEQIYGTQATQRKLKNGKEFRFIWPIQSPGDVNRLRKEAGFNTTIEEYAREMGIRYQVVTMDDL